MEHLKAYNQKLLANILPEHVAAHFLSTVNSDVSSIRIALSKTSFFQEKFPQKGEGGRFGRMQLRKVLRRLGIIDCKSRVTNFS